uniref:Mitochondrial protein n=1 Tax=Ananas comosus var. bracteatus TaxID=296719 RepID=A0A6V7NL98_ANACO|nr:unnamed protein product [Ananas comosus var. bracteatus]
MEIDWPPMVDGDNGGPSYCCGNRGPDYGEDGASCGVKSRHQFARVLVKHFRKTMRANQRCVEEEFSAVLFGVWVASVDDSLPREDAVTHLTSFVSRLLVLAVDTYSHKIKNLLEPHPEHGRIQFHRLNIKNGSQPEGLIKMTDLSASSTHRRSTAGSSSTDSTSRTTPDSRASSRYNQPGGHLFPAVYNFHPPYTAISLMPFRWLSIGLKTASGSFTSPLMRCWEDYWKLSPKGSLSATVHILSQFMQNPRMLHWDAAMRVFRYLKQSPGQEILFSVPTSLQLTAYCDSDWAACPMMRCSVTGYFVMFGGRPISWKTKKHTIMSRSSAEAEVHGSYHQ